MRKQQFSATLSSTIDQEEPSNLKLIRTQVAENNQLVEKFFIGKYQYLASDYLGEGFSSSVYKATLIANKRERFAIKVIDLSKFQSSEMQLLEMEMEIMASLNHPNVIKCVDTYKTSEKYFLVMEYCPHGDLNELIKLQNYIPEEKVILIMKQIIDGYKYLMSKNILHRDLKPANIMRFGNQWKIGDFGFGKYCKQEYILEKLYVGTPFYMPPQALQFNKYSYKSDIFALGIILFQMLTGQTPWPSKDEKQLVDSMKENQIIFPSFLISQQLKQFLKRSLVIDFYARMNKQEFKMFSLQNVDVQKVAKTRPGRGISPCLKRELSKSGKKSFMFSTPLKQTKNAFFCTSTNKTKETEAKFSRPSHHQKVAFQYLKPYIHEDYGIEGSPLSVKFLKQNADMMSNQLEIVKLMIGFVSDCDALMLCTPEQSFVCLIMFSLGLKMLKMVTNKRQNYYRFNKWDVFKQSDKYQTYVTNIFAFVTRFQTQYKNYKNSVQKEHFDSFSQQFPQLVGKSSISFKTYAKIFIKLKQIVKNHILSQQKIVPQEQVKREQQQKFITKKCYNLKFLIEILTMIKNRSRREQEIKGFGLKTKPECLSLKNVSWSMEALKFTMKQLEILCKHKVEIQ